MTLVAQITVFLVGLVLLAKDLITFWSAGASPDGIEREGPVRPVRLVGGALLIVFSFWLPNGVQEAAKIVCGEVDAVERSNSPADKVADSKQDERRPPLAEDARWFCGTPAPQPN